MTGLCVCRNISLGASDKAGWLASIVPQLSMKTVLSAVLFVAVAYVSRAALLLEFPAAAAIGSNPANVRRLDGSTITAAKIDDTVSRLMSAGKVTGVGLAFLVDTKPAGTDLCAARAPFPVDGDHAPE